MSLSSGPRRRRRLLRRLSSSGSRLRGTPTSPQPGSGTMGSSTPRTAGGNDKLEATISLRAFKSDNTHLGKYCKPPPPPPDRISPLSASFSFHATLSTFFLFLVSSCNLLISNITVFSYLRREDIMMSSVKNIWEPQKRVAHCP